MTAIVESDMGYEKSIERQYQVRPLKMKLGDHRTYRNLDILCFLELPACPLLKLGNCGGIVILRCNQFQRIVCVPSIYIAVW